MRLNSNLSSVWDAHHETKNSQITIQKTLPLLPRQCKRQSSKEKANDLKNIFLPPNILEKTGLKSREDVLINHSGPSDK